VSYDWSLPYSAARSPIFARNLVATSQPLAAAAGIDALKAGGNAVDAALAMAITLTVVEPNNNGIGSDAFAIIWDGKSLEGLNASGRSPSGWHPERFKDRDTMPVLGWDSVTTPGAVSAWVSMSERYGRLPFEDLFKAAIHYAEKGFAVGPKTGYFWKLAEQRYASFPSFCDTFFPGGSAPAIGETIRLPDHASTLKKIAASKGVDFYQGELASLIAADSARLGGALTEADLAAHQADWIKPISQAYRDYELHEIPPSGQGLMALIGVGILDHFDMKHPLDSADSIHLQIEAIRGAYAEIERHLADIDAMDVTVEQLLNPAWLAKKAAAIDPDRAESRPFSLPKSEDTVYLTAADENGMMVSMIQSNYRGFGSGIVVPGTGISMQNRGNGFTLESGHPNEVAGGKRPYHTIIPGFVTQNGKPTMSFGVMGGHMQAQGHLQMMVRMFDYNQNPQAASDAPRWHLMEDGTVALEAGVKVAVAEELKRKGHEIVLHEPEHVFGGAQLIARLDDGYCGGSDHRKEGLATGY